MNCFLCRDTVEVGNLYKTSITLPITISQPSIDRSELLYGIIDENAYQNAITSREGNDIKLRIDLLWNNEHHPIWVADIAYRLYRSYKYQRIQDIQSFNLIYRNGEIISIESSNFTEDPTYTFNVIKSLEHKTYGYGINELKRDQYGNYILYVATWNHIFSKDDNNDELNKDIFRIGSSLQLHTRIQGVSITN